MKTNGYHNHKLEENARLRKGTRKGRNRKPALRILSATLSLSMLLSGCGPLSLTPLTTIPNGVEQIESALQQDGGDSDAAKRTDTVITGFADLTDDIREQTVPLGTAIEELTLPDTLEAYIVEKDAENGGGGVKPPEDSEENPGDGEEPPTEDDKKPGDGEEPPTEDDKKPGDGEEPPTEDDKKPGDGEEPPTEGDKKPGDGEEPPTEGDKKPGDGEEPPTEGDKKPGDGEEPPTEGDKKPGDGEEPPAEDGKKPDDGEGGSNNNTGDSAAAVGFGIETGSFVIPVYGSENTQDDMKAEALTADGQDADTTPAEEDAGTDNETKKVTIENVTWQSDPSYDGDTKGLYLFTPILPEEYELAEDVGLPEIRVSVGCVHGIVAAGEVCPVCELQEQIDALPEAEEVEEALAGLTTGTSQMSVEEIDALYELLFMLSDTYDGFPEEWQAMVNAEKLFALLSLFSGEDMLMTTAGGKDVLIFSTTTNNMTSDAEIAEKVLSYVFSEAGYGVQIKCGKKEEQHLTETDMDGIGLLIFLLPRSAPNDTDISLMRDFLAGGGRIVMIGENGRFFAKENAVLSAAAEKLGADFRISDRAIGRECSIVKGTANMPENALTKDVKQSLTSHYVAPIIYTGSAEPVLLLDGQAWMVDQAAGMGRITTLTDINCFDPVRGYIPQKKADTKAWILRWLLDARNNQQLVLSNQDPNLGFGGSPSVSVDAKEHVSVLGDYSFTVTYSGADKSPNSVIDETTIGTDDVTVKDSAGVSLLISKAEIVSGQGTKKLVVRYTVEAQQSNYFTPGDYTIGINNAAVADKAGKEVGGDPKAAVFHVIASPLEIAGPDNLVIPQGGTGSLSVSVSTTDGKSYTYQYQWYQKKNGVYEKVTGATRASYTLPAAVTGVSGEYTYRCEVWASGHPEFRIPSEDALVTVEKGLAIDTPTAAEIAGKDCDYTLSATLLEAGSERIVETGFVWGIMASPTLSLNSGSAKTASPVTAANQKIIVSATELTKTVTYYGRAYVKTAGGNVVYSNAVSFGKTGNMGQFSVQNNGDNTFTVTLANGVGEQMVFYRTVNGSAVGGTHFTHKAGMLTFNGSGSQTVTVPESAVTSTYDGKAATAYSNADRTCSLEIYRPMGGAAISTGTAERTMKADDSYRVSRTYYNGIDQKVHTGINNFYVADRTAGNTDNRVFFSSDRKDKEGRALNNVPDPYFSGFYQNFNVQRNMDSYFNEKEKAYLKATSVGYLYNLHINAREEIDGWEHIWIAKHAPDQDAFRTSNGHDGPIGLDDSVKGAAQFTARWDIEGNGEGSVIYADLYFPKGTGTHLDAAVSRNVRDGAQEGDFLVFGLDETVNVWFGASGKKEDIWCVNRYNDCFKMKDTVEPRLVGVAPMAQTAYAIGDNITIALVFDEIVDVTNSTLGSVKIKTNVTNDLSYSGGGNTNVLYFTGKVTTEFKGGEIQVNGITGSVYIKDMCDTFGTANTNTSGSTPITTTGASAPKLTLTNNGVTDGYAKAQLSAQNATLLQYCWTQDAGMPAAGWHKAGSPAAYTATNPAQTAGTYYLHTMAINQSTGEAAYERTSFTVTQQQQQEQENKLVLTAETDNSQWARSRTILLEKKGSGTLTLSVTKPDGTSQSVAGNSYTATANGNYVFTLLNGSKSVTKTVTVEKIDRTNPKVTVSAIPTAWQASMPTVTISGTDTNGSGIASLQYKWVTTKDAYPTSGLSSLGKTGTSVSGPAGNTGVTDGVNYLYYKAMDGVGNTVQGYSSALRLDRITPTITLGAAQVDGPNAIFSVTVKYGPSSGKTTFQKQGDGAAMSVRGSAAGISETTYKYQLKANAGVNEAGNYTFTATSGAGKTAAKTAPGIYQITLNAGEGVFESDMQAEDEEPPHTDTWLVVSGGKIVKPTYGAPVREHYTLKDWYTNSACTALYNFDTTVTANRTLYAGWTPDSYQITYVKNYGTITNENNYKTYTYSQELTLPTAAQTKRTGYTFDGWYTDEAFADGTKVTKLTATDADDKTFYAKWTANKYTLTYDYQGATGSNTTETKTVTYDADYGTLPSPEKTGYSFKGWYTQTGGQGSKVLGTTKMTKTQDHRLYAYWVDDLKPDAPVLQDGVTLPKEWTHTQKTIPLTLHDGVGVTGLLVSVDGGTYTEVSGFTGQPGNDAYDYVYGGVQEGSHTYRFKAKDAARNVSLESEEFTVKLDTTEAGLTVTGPNAGAEKKTGLVLTAKSGSFGPSGGTLSVKKEGLLATETELASSTSGGVLSAVDKVTGTGTYHFYSRTNANKADDAAAKETRYVRQVTFDSDDGSAVEPQLVWTSQAAADANTSGTVECKVQKPADPEKRGLVFGGWYTDEKCKNAFDFDSQIYEDTTLYAKWTADSYKVTYHLTNPDGSDYQAPDAYQTYTFGEGLTLPVPELEGYRFEGWYLEADHTGDIQTEITENETEARTYYARYVDIAAPQITAEVSTESRESGWHTERPDINLTYSDNQGVKRLFVSVDGEEWRELSGFPMGNEIKDDVEYTWAFSDLRQGDHTYAFRAVDAMGLSTETKPLRVKLDTVKPVIGELIYENRVANLWQWMIGKKSMVIHVPVTDAGSNENAGSGVKKISYTMTPKAADGTPDGGRAKTKTAAIEDGEAKIAFDEDFRGDIAIACTDVAGNDADIVTVGVSGSGGVIVEDTPPVVMFRTPAANEKGWYKESLDVTVTVTDGGQEDVAVTSGGIARIDWKEEEDGAKQIIEGLPGDSPVYRKEFTIPAAADGIHTYYVEAADNAGNESGWETVTVKLDATKPVIGEITYNEGYVNLWDWLIRKDSLIVNIPVTEEMSGLDRVTYTLTPGSMQDAEPVTKEAKIEKTTTDAGTKYMATIVIDPDYKGVIGNIRATDIAGNVSEPVIAYANGIGVIVEEQKPVITVKADRLTTDGQAGTGSEGEELSAEYYQTAPELLVKVQDGSMAASGIKEVKWRIGSGSEHTENGGFADALKTEYGFRIAFDDLSGTVQTEISAMDNAGNSESQTVTVRIKGKEQTPEAETDYFAEKLTGQRAGEAYLVRLPGGKTVSRKADEDGEISIDNGWFGKEISLIKKGDGKNTTNSDPQSIVLAARPAAPILEKSDETIKGKKDGQVTGVTDVMEISRDGKKTWEKAEGAVTDAAAGKLWARVAATQTAPRGEEASVTIGQGRSLTVTFDSQGGSRVKPIKGLSWKEAVKKPAEPKKEGDNGFCGWYREAAYENKWHFAEDAEADLMTDDVTLFAKWLPKADAPMTAGISFRDETLTKLEPGKVYLIEGKEVAASAEGTVPIDESWFGKKIGIVRRGDGSSTGDSDALRLHVPNRPAGPAKVQPKAESAQEAKDGKLTKTDTTMQYRRKGSTEWINITGEEITGLEPGDYELRYVSTDTAFSSKIVVKTVKQYSPPKGGGENNGGGSGGNDGGGNGSGDNGGGNSGDNGGGNSGDNGGTKPGDGTKTDDGKKPGDGTNPGDGTKPGDGKKPGDGTKPGDGKNPGDGTKPGDGKNPGDGKKPDDGMKPGDDKKPGNGSKPGDGTKPGDDKNPGDGSNPPIGGEVPKIPVIIEDGKIVISGIGGTGGTGADGTGGIGGTDGTGADGTGGIGGTDGTGADVIGGTGGAGADGTGGTGANGGGIATGNVPGMTGAGTASQNGESAMSTMLQLGDGAIIVTVVCKGEHYTAGVTDTVAVANAALTTEQIQLAEGGETIEIRVEVTDISESVPRQDKEAIEGAVEAYQSEIQGLTLGIYIDISVFIRVGGGDWNAIRKTGEPIDVIIGIPEDLQSRGRAYYIIRAHDGECTLLDDTDETEDTITIRSDLFSSYAIAYQQTDNAGADAKCGLCHICPTFLGICYFIWLAVILAVIVIIILLLRRRKKEEEQEGQNG